MIFDAELMFFDNEALKAETIASNTLYVGKGDAGSDMTLVCKLTGTTGSGSVNVELITASDEGFKDAKTLGNFTAPFQVKLPRGNRGYLKLSAESTFTTGKLTAALVYDDDVH